MSGVLVSIAAQIFLVFFGSVHMHMACMGRRQLI